MRKNFIILIAFSILGVLLFHSTADAGLVYDFNGWANKYENASIKEFLNSFGYNGLHQIEQLFFFSFYHLFKFNGFLWMLLFVVLHSLATLSAFQLSETLLDFFIKKKSLHSLIVAILFFISPFAVDVVVSKVCIHYFISAILLFQALRFLLLYNFKNKYKHLLVSCLLFVLALFTLEIAFAFPIIVLFTTIIMLKRSLISFQKGSKVVVVFFALISVFLVLHKLLIGTFIGHYGAEVHSQFSLQELLVNFHYYLWNYIFFFDYWNYKYKAKALEIIGGYYLVFLGLYSVIVFYLFVKLKTLQKNIILLLLAFGAFLIFLLPILNLHCVVILPIENDRYSYFASFFLYFAIVYFLYTYFPKFKYIVISVFFILNLFFTIRNINTFSLNGQIASNLIDGFDKKYVTKDVFILLQPDNVGGSKLFATHKENGSEFTESLFLERGTDIRENTTLIYELNVNSIQDSVYAYQVDQSTIQLTLQQWGGWFWKYHRGALDYESNEFKVKRLDGLNYEISFVNGIPSNAVFIYYSNGQWETVELNLRNEL